MLSSTASPFKRQSAEIPQSMQKLIAKLQTRRKNRKSMNGSLSLEYTSLGRKRVNFPVKDVIDPTKKTVDLTAGNQFTGNASATTGGVPTRNDNSSRNSVAESTLQNYNSFKKRKLADSFQSIEGVNSAITGKADDSVAILNEELPIVPQENVDSSSKNFSKSFKANDDVISVEQSSSVLITTDFSRVRKLSRPKTSAPLKQKSITGQEFSENQRSSPVPAEKSAITFIAEKKLNSNGKNFITDEEKSTVSPRADVPDECTNTIIEQDKISKKISAENTNSVATITATGKSDDACGFITFNNIMQYSKRGSFTNDLFSDDDGDDKMSECAKEFQDKGVQVPDESLQVDSDICEQLRPLLQKIRGLNDMILKAKEQIPNFSKIRSISDVGEA